MRGVMKRGALHPGTFVALVINIVTGSLPGLTTKHRPLGCETLLAAINVKRYDLIDENGVDQPLSADRLD
jgi:hypothetical protein